METGVNIQRSSLVWWFWQIAPPAGLLCVTFGNFNIAIILIVGIPFLVSVLRIMFLVARRQFGLLLRPALTIACSFLVFIMGAYYAEQSKRYVRRMAEAMQEQCNRDGYCGLPSGRWKQSEYDKKAYYGRAPGLVHFSIALAFDELAPSPELAAASIVLPRKEFKDTRGTAGSQKYSAFHLTRVLEESHFHMFGGVGLPLRAFVGSGAKWVPVIDSSERQSER